MNIFRRLLLGIVIFGLVLSTSAQSVQTGTSICLQIEKSVNTLATFTLTSCLPGAGVAKGSLSFIVISNKEIFTVESAKKAWLITVVGAAGSALNETRNATTEELVVSDASHMKGSVAFTLPTNFVKSVQSRAKNGQIKLDDMYLEIQKNLKRKLIQAK